MSEPVATFRASLASTGKWLKIGDAGDATATFDVSVVSLPDVVRLAAHGQEELEITVRHVKACDGILAQ